MSTSNLTARPFDQLIVFISLRSTSKLATWQNLYTRPPQKGAGPPQLSAVTLAAVKESETLASEQFSHMSQIASTVCCEQDTGLSRYEADCSNVRSSVHDKYTSSTAQKGIFKLISCFCYTIHQLQHQFPHRAVMVVTISLSNPPSSSAGYQLDHLTWSCTFPSLLWKYGHDPDQTITQLKDYAKDLGLNGVEDWRQMKKEAEFLALWLRQELNSTHVVITAGGHEFTRGSDGVWRRDKPHITVRFHKKTFHIYFSRDPSGDLVITHYTYAKDGEKTFTKVDAE
ncbi:hypothetical protein FB567DRAFT_612889 [Paraphoma chrysanthemicola]|uniref:Uncharacterized protein n=1 Tax=Paraphoma chrysanthemicola TaxID=798071 RepID=A0A8K0QV91_9PLEO|nr:hypothetical protein FB567DRAFT_612889 [Paraphoma chrysanthemicola]